MKQLKGEGYNYNAELCMVGPDADGSLKSVKLLAEELNITVKFTGKLTKTEWIDLASDYNIFINTTNFDNMPVSVIKAMTLGFPIVSTNVAGLPLLNEDKKDGILYHFFFNNKRSSFSLSCTCIFIFFGIYKDTKYYSIIKQEMV